MHTPSLLPTKKRTLRRIAAVSLSALVLFAATACSSLDVVGKTAVTSFEQIVQAATITPDDAYVGWSLEAPDQSARFFFSRDLKTSTPHDVMIETDAQPFIDAGLDPARLPAGVLVDGMLMLGQSLGDEAFAEADQKSAEASFAKIITLNRSAIDYHEALDHYGIDLGNGNKFEWAKDRAKNDKDIVFVLDPKLLMDAGVDPAKVTGWVYAKVPMKDAAGKPIEVDKFLKPFDL
jgi:hypothetical protein